MQRINGRSRYLGSPDSDIQTYYRFTEWRNHLVYMQQLSMTFLKNQRHCHFSTVYFCAFMYEEQETAWNYINSVSQTASYEEVSWWIRRSNGRLCADLGGADYIFGLHPAFFRNPRSLSNSLTALNHPIEDAAVLSFLTLEEYHGICDWYLSKSRFFAVPPEETMKLHTVVSCFAGDQPQQVAETAMVRNIALSVSWSLPQHAGEGMADGWGSYPWSWRRYESRDVAGQTLTFNVYCQDDSHWLGQANHIFGRLAIKSKQDAYFIVRRACFKISISQTTQTPPQGYLFVCPVDSFQTGPRSCSWPKLPAYWSSDPCGVRRFSAEEAAGLGFPGIELTTGFWGNYWNASVYDGIRQFHQVKGFDPDSQDVARRLDHPLYTISEPRGLDDKFVHVDDNFTEDIFHEHGNTSSEEELDEFIDSPFAFFTGEEGTQNFDLGPTGTAGLSLGGDNGGDPTSGNTDGMNTEDREMNFPSMIQLSLIVILALFSLYDYLRSAALPRGATGPGLPGP
ncbi:hypothetical protein K438DRAFT_1943225 [Mycena galopus ATCC 62051]|nr:hypothetical protein K438DRAFT_1943225 [Mycena galopus ATCC 62051]